MSEKQLRVCIGFGLGNISTVTLPFASNLRKNGIVNVFTVPSISPYKELLENGKIFTIDFMNRENETELLNTYTVMPCNNVEELEAAIKAESMPKDDIVHILYPLAMIKDIVKIPNLQMACAFTAVGAGNLLSAAATANEIAGNYGTVPLYLLENLSAEKQDLLGENEYKNLTFRNGVLRRTSGGFSAVGTHVTIKTVPASLGSIKYERRASDEELSPESDGVAIIPMSTEEINGAESSKYIGSNLIDFIIARYTMLGNVENKNAEFLFDERPELGDKMMGEYMSEQCEADLTAVLSFIATYTLNCTPEEVALTLPRVKKMKKDTFGRILKTNEKDHVNKLSFAQRMAKNEILSNENDDAASHLAKDIIRTALSI